MPNSITSHGAGHFKPRPTFGSGFGLLRWLRMGTLPGASGPSSLTATAIAPLEVRLAWSHLNVPADTVHQIERSDGAGGWYRVGSAYGGRLAFTDIHRTPNTSYTYRVRAVNSGGTSAYTASATVTTMNEDGSGEFVGPLAGWVNIKNAPYNAVGNGIADDTAAIQQALTDLTTHVSGRYVLYFPAGTYKVTSLISTTRANTQDGSGMGIVGADPTTTIIKWAGASGGDMIYWDNWYSKISRITFDGSGTAGVLLTHGGNFSTFNETSDCVFKDCQIGLRMGDVPPHAGQAERMITRCYFLRCSNQGAQIAGSNSLDIWFWHNHFQTCDQAIHTISGNFHAWHNYFQGSTSCDMSINANMVFSVVNNVSIGSQIFADFSNAQDLINPVTWSGNRIINPLGAGSLWLSRLGPSLVFDNLFRARAGVTTPQLRTDPFTPGSSLAHGNLYSISGGHTDSGSLLRSLDEEQPTTQPIDPNPPYLPGTPPNNNRTIFEVAAGASASTIQTAITNANSAGARSVVHLPIGVYNINSTLTVPANSTIQIMGDAASDVGTILNWTGAAGQPVLRFVGPSKALLRDCQILPGSGIGVLADGIDQDGGHVFLDQANCHGDSSTTLGFLIDGLEHCDVTGMGQQGANCGTLARVVGGTLRNAGSAAPNRICWLTGATTTSVSQYEVTNGGELTVRGVFQEVDTVVDSNINLTSAHRGKIAVDSTRFSYQVDGGTPAIRLNGFVGDFLLTTGYMLTVSAPIPPADYSHNLVKVSVIGNGSQTRAMVLTSGFDQYFAGNTLTDAWENTSNPAAAAYLERSVLRIDGALTNQGSVSDNTLRAMLNLLRQATVRLPGTTPAGVTDLRLHRVWIRGGANGQDLVLRS